MTTHKVIAEDFPFYRSMMENLGVGNCEATRRIVFKDLQKHFKPLTIEGIPSRPDGEFRSETFRHIAQKYTFVSRTLVINCEYQAQGYDIDLGDGVHLITRFVEPLKRGMVMPTDKESWLYLVFLYRKKINRANPFKKVMQFLEYMKQMEGCPIEVAFFRPHGIQEWSHFKTLDMVDCPNATTSRLKNAYRRALGAKPMNVFDDEGQPYWEIPIFMKK